MAIEHSATRASAQSDEDEAEEEEEDPEIAQMREMISKLMAPISEKTRHISRKERDFIVKGLFKYLQIMKGDK